MRKPLAIAALVAVLMLPGATAVAEDGVPVGTCPSAMTGAEFGAHVSQMAQSGALGPHMNPGMHQGYSRMAH